MGLTALAPLIGGAANGIMSIFSGNAKADAAQQAANIQANAAGQGINAISNIQGQQTANAQPYMSAGATSLGQLMQLLQNGTFGAGSTGQAPQFDQTFTAPTLADAMQSPGYQFTAQQGSKGILQGAAAAGGAISGGTLKALDSYNTGLANNTYSDVFNRSMQGYNASLAKYNAQLSGYGAKLAGQQQEFNQMSAPIGYGLSATNALNTNLGTDAHSIADLFTQQGNARAAGIVGSTNNTWGGLQSGIGQMTGYNGSDFNNIGQLFGGGVSTSGTPDYGTYGSGPSGGSVFDVIKQMPKGVATPPQVGNRPG